MTVSLCVNKNDSNSGHKKLVTARISILCINTQSIKKQMNKQTNKQKKKNNKLILHLLLPVLIHTPSLDFNSFCTTSLNQVVWYCSQPRSLDGSTISNRSTGKGPSRIFLTYQIVVGSHVIQTPTVGTGPHGYDNLYKMGRTSMTLRTQSLPWNVNTSNSCVQLAIVPMSQMTVLVLLYPMKGRLPTIPILHFSMLNLLFTTWISRLGFRPCIT